MEPVSETEKANQKLAFCREIYGVDKWSDCEGDEPDDLAVLLQASRAKSAKSRKALRSANPISSSLSISSPAASWNSEGSGKARSESAQMTSAGVDISKKRSSKGPSGAVAAKKKRADSVRIRPEEQLIFKGMVFC